MTSVWCKNIKKMFPLIIIPAEVTFLLKYNGHKNRQLSVTSNRTRAGTSQRRSKMKDPGSEESFLGRKWCCRHNIGRPLTKFGLFQSTAVESVCVAVCSRTTTRGSPQSINRTSIYHPHSHVWSAEQFFLLILKFPSQSDAVCTDIVQLSLWIWMWTYRRTSVHCQHTV